MGNKQMWWRVLLSKSIEPENRSLKIVVKNSKSTPVEKWVNCELQITIFTENGLDTIANVMKNVLWSLKAIQQHISKLEALWKTLTKSFKTPKFKCKTPKFTIKKYFFTKKELGMCCIGD